MAANNIILCSDGTGNTDTEGRGTNVFKLYEAVDIHGHLTNPARPRQIAFYDDGVGTENFALHKAIGAAFGLGFAQNVRDLYTALVHVYTPDDKPFLFGFSRGAYTIRALSGLIQYCGVLDRQAFSSEEELKEAVDACWDAFEEVAFPRFIRSQWDRQRRAAQPVEEDASAAALRRKELGSHAQSVGIHFIGVWDTVGAVGMPVDWLKPLVNWICPRKFDELTPGKEVGRACHALSIDDERRTFHPELWNERGAREGQIEQVWFAGVHSNVGGGYPKHGMSLVTLDWMMSEAEKHGLRFIDGARNYVRTQKDVHSKLYDSRSGLAVYYRWDPRNIADICRIHGIDRPKVHESVFERIAFRTDGYAPCNIPANLEVVNGPQARTEEICRLVCHGINSLSVPSLLDLGDVRRWVWIGKLTYAGFLALSLFAIGWGLYNAIPAPAEATIPGRAWEVIKSSLGIVTSMSALWDMLVKVVHTWWWYLPVMAFCYAISILVDYKMEDRFSGFWHQRRERLREIFSWFWFPKNNLLNPIFNVLGGSKCILAIGNNGAEAVEYAKDYREQIQGSLDEWKGSIEAVLISGGGNDFAGLDDMFRIIRTKCDGFTSVDQCFNAGEPGKLFDEVADGYRALIEMVFVATPQAKIFIHNYDRAIPTGKGFVGNGNWLKEPMTRAHVDLSLQQGIVNRLLFEFTQRLKAVESESDQIHFVDSARLRSLRKTENIKGRGTLTRTEWGDELHPKPAGFNKVARLCWGPAFAAAGLI